MALFLRLMLTLQPLQRAISAIFPTGDGLLVEDGTSDFLLVEDGTSDVLLLE